ncbi:MFS transporter, partial [Butyricicoccus sp. 1XD8-22]
FLAEIGSRVPFFTAAGFALFAAVLSIITLREPGRDHEDVGTGQKAGIKRIFIPKYFFAFMIILITSFGLAVFESLFSLFVDHKFAFTPKDIAIVITGGA